MQHRDSPENNPSIPFKFNAQNEKLIQEVLARYPSQYKKAAVMPLLDLGQRQHGFTSISVMNEVARLLEMPPMRVYEVATFYAHFDIVKEGEAAPPPITIRVCESLSCAMAGADGLIDRLSATLRTNVRVLRAPCMGGCDQAPPLLRQTLKRIGRYDIETGREKLNLSNMQPSLAFVDSTTGRLISQHMQRADIHKLSIRHLVQDAGHGYAIPDFVRSSWISIIGSVVLVVVVWVIVLARWGQA